LFNYPVTKQEHHLDMVGVVGSNPIASTILFIYVVKQANC